MAALYYFRFVTNWICVQAPYVGAILKLRPDYCLVCNFVDTRVLTSDIRTCTCINQTFCGYSKDCFIEIETIV